jgi:hypothetical protein
MAEGTNGVCAEPTLDGWLEIEGVAEANLEASLRKGDIELEIPPECLERN